ncbi:hypothetical protein ACFX13_044312 [Malus domestica]
MVEEYKDLERVMREKKLAPSLPYVKTLFLGRFEPLREAIVREQQVQHIDLLPPDKMALIVMHKMMGLVMVGNQDGDSLAIIKEHRRLLSKRLAVSINSKPSLMY